MYNFDNIDRILCFEFAEKFAKLKPNEQRIIRVLWKIGSAANFTHLTEMCSKKKCEVTNIRKIAIGLEAKGFIRIVRSEGKSPSEKNYIQEIYLPKDFMEKICNS